MRDCGGNLNWMWMMVRQNAYFLWSTRVQALVERQHLTQAQVADQLGISRSYWSQLVNRRRSLTPAVRSRILRSRCFKGVAESELWEVVGIGGGQ